MSPDVNKARLGTYASRGTIVMHEGFRTRLVFRKEKIIVPGRLHVVLAIIVAFTSFAANHYSPAAGIVLALVAVTLIGLQFWFAFRIWPTYGYGVNPCIFGLYWGLVSGLILPFILSVAINEGVQGVWELLNGE